MAIKNDVLIVNRQGGFPPMVREQLQARGFTTQLFDDIEGALKALLTLKRPILAIDAGSDAALGRNYAEQLITQASRIRCPVLMIASGVDEYSRGLTQYLPTLHTLNAPVKATEILQTLEFIADSYGRSQTSTPAKSIPAPQVSKAEEKRSGTEDPRSARQNLSPTQVQSALFQELAQRGGPKLGGEDYIRLGREEVLRALGVVPSEGKVAGVAEQILTDAGSWARGHLMRTAFLALRIADTLTIEPKLQERIKEACYLFAWSFAGAQPELLRAEYHTNKSKATRMDICSKIKDSAMNSAMEFQSQELGTIIATVAKLIGQEETTTDTAVGLAASAIAGAELVDRVCCLSGHFNPRRACFLLKKIQKPNFSDIHPAVVACLVKFLGEAVNARSNRFIVPKSIKRQRPVFERAKAHFEEEVRGTEMKVPLDELQPGMKLSRALLTFDGKELLTPGLTLDADLILRLWGLSSVRSVDAPVIHRASKAKIV